VAPHKRTSHRSPKRPRRWILGIQRRWVIQRRRDPSKELYDGNRPGPSQIAASQSKRCLLEHFSPRQEEAVCHRSSRFMKHILFALALLCSLITASQASNIVIMVVEDPNNYEAPRTMRDFAEKQLRPLGHHVTIIDGDKPQPHHFAGLVEALQDADLLVLFSRRRFPPTEQMAAIRTHLDAGKPLLGIRTANHAFIP